MYTVYHLNQVYFGLSCLLRFSCDSLPVPAGSSMLIEKAALQVRSLEALQVAAGLAAPVWLQQQSNTQQEHLDVLHGFLLRNEKLVRC